MTALATSGEIELRRLVWVGPITVAGSVIAVWIVQQISLAILPTPLPRFSGSVLNSDEPAIVTAVLVTGAILTLPIVADSSTNPLRSFRRLAFVVLVLSCIPNLVAVVSRQDLGMLALMVLHVVAWAVTVTMLTKLAFTSRDAAA